MTAGGRPQETLVSEQSLDYAACVRRSEAVAWRLDDVMPRGTRLDFTRPFMPEELARTSRIKLLDEAEQLRLNQITGNAYLNLFAFVEEFIIAMVVSLAQSELSRDHDAIRALSRFADEEVKHQQLFTRFREAFDRDFGHPCAVLSSAADVSRIVLAKRPLAVLLLTLHLELLTQRHYVAAVKDDRTLDPFFCSLLHAHWLEESQHARIDTLQMSKLAEGMSRASIEAAMHDYLAILEAFDGLLAEQARMDVDSIAMATGRTFDDAERAQVEAGQHSAYRHTFIVLGMTHPPFVATLRRLAPHESDTVIAAASRYS